MRSNFLEIQSRLINDNTVDMPKFEFMIYQLISEKIEAGHIYVQHSISFKCLSSHLISDDKWRNKTELLKKLGTKKLLMPIDQLLDGFENTLEKLIKNVKVNREINQNGNFQMVKH